LHYQFVKYDEIDSTSSELARLANKGLAFEGTVVLAVTQTKGRGRLNRIWQSAPDNLYFSLLLNPRSEASSEASLDILSLCASAAMHMAICDEFPERQALLKWPNDILVDGKKVAGILLEARVSQSNELDYVIIGIGVNLLSFPENLGDVASSLVQTGVAANDVQSQKEALLAGFLEKFRTVYASWQAAEITEILEYWRNNTYKPGDSINININGEIISATFEDINNDGSLSYRNANGTMQTTRTAEIELIGAIK
jgi:BirA family biotin operon repressor/biotin-[acetyl-CoA-carboxylase] ligase